MEENPSPSPLGPTPVTPLGPPVAPVPPVPPVPPAPESVGQNQVVLPPSPTPGFQPDPTVAPATINVHPAVQSGSFVPPAPTPPSEVEEAYRPKARPALSSPLFVALMSFISLVMVFVFSTYGVSVNTWVKLASLLVLSAISLWLSMRAYESDNTTIILVSLIISTMVFAGTLVVGSTYVYYYEKFKQIGNTFGQFD